MRVIAVRIAIKLQAAKKPAAARTLGRASSRCCRRQGVDPELDVIKRRHHADLRQAMREAFSTLSADERHLLRLHFVDRLSTYELASLFRVNQSTISRWLKSARQTVYKETRRRLQERLGLSTQDFQSFLAARSTASST